MAISRRRRTALTVGLGGLLMASPAAGLGLGLRNYKNQGTLTKKNTARARAQQMHALMMTRQHAQPFVPKNLGHHRVNTSKDLLKLAKLSSLQGRARVLVWDNSDMRIFKDRDFYVHMARLYDANATSLTAAADPYGIAPGTHLASRFADMLPLFASTDKRWIKHSSSANTGGLKGNTILSLYHHAVYLGNGLTFGIPEGINTLSHFMEGNKAYYEIVYPHSSLEKKKAIFRRVAHVFTEIDSRPDSNFSRYSAIRRNCEHMATYLMTGKATSIQATRAKIVWLGVGAVFASRVLARAVFFVKKVTKLMRRWGFKPGMRKDAIDQTYDRQRRTYSFLNSIRGRIPRELTNARNASLTMREM